MHLTLNAEKRHYKWRPLTAPSPRVGPRPTSSAFSIPTWRRRAGTRIAEAVEAELRAQIDAAYAAGIDVTHLDAHMGAAFSPEFCDIYIRLGLEYRLPILLTSTIAAYAPNDNLVGVTEEAHGKGVDRARAAGFAIFDAATPDDLEPAAVEARRARLQGADRRRSRRADLLLPAFQRAGRAGADRAALGLHPHRGIRAFPQRGFSRMAAAQDLEIIGMRPLRDELRARLPV